MQLGTNMKILVTGGAGYVGSNLCNSLIKENHEVICLDNDFNQDYFIDEKTKRLLHDIRMDLPKDFRNKKIDYIYHLAALPRIASSFSNPENVIDINANGTLKILELARTLECPVNFISSSSVKSNLYANPYTYSKIMAEQHCVFYNTVFQTPVMITRLFNVYGRNHPRTDKKACLIGILENNILENKKTTIYGDGQQKRDFTHIDDICEGLLETLSCKHIGQQIDLGFGKSYSINEVVKLMNITNISYVEKRRGDGLDTLAETSSTNRFIKWNPKNRLEDYLTVFRQTLLAQQTVGLNYEAAVNIHLD